MQRRALHAAIRHLVDRGFPVAICPHGVGTRIGINADLTTMKAAVLGIAAKLRPIADGMPAAVPLPAPVVSPNQRLANALFLMFMMTPLLLIVAICSGVEGFAPLHSPDQDHAVLAALAPAAAVTLWSLATSTPVPHLCRVVSMQWEDLKYASPWGNTNRTVYVSRALGGAFKKGDTVDIATKAGAFGWEWLSDVWAP